MQAANLKNKKIVVTGGTGFLGKALVQELENEQPAEIRVFSSKEFDLRQIKDAEQIVKGADIVIHLAASVGGIGYNQSHPAELFYDNILMGTHTLHAAYMAGVEKFVGIGTICAYPKLTPIPFQERDLWSGYPEETNAPYGLAKKMLLVQSQAYRAQYGFNAIYLLPTNLYGPGDNFEPQSSHVIPALIHKFVEAKQNKAKQVQVWGTGKPTREFLYVADAARGIIAATKKYNQGEPVNLGSSFEISIAELAEEIKTITGFTGEIVFDTTKPDGQPRRKIDTSKAKELFDFESKVTFAEGLRRTVAWYLETHT